MQYPRLPGHEVIGVVDAVGRGVPNGRLVNGWAWAGMVHLRPLRPCRSGNFFGCQVDFWVTGISFDGGYAEYMVAPAKRWRWCPRICLG